MYYYLLEIANGDKSIAGRAVYGYETENEAIAMFHKKMGTAMASNLFASEMLMVIDYAGKVIKREFYIKPLVPETSEVP